MTAKFVDTSVDLPATNFGHAGIAQLSAFADVDLAKSLALRSRTPPGAFKCLSRQPDKPVTYEGLRRSTANMFPAEIVSRVNAKNLNPESVAKDYWRLAAEACPEAWNDRPEDVIDPETDEVTEVPVKYRLKDLVGFAAVAKLGRDIITSALEAPRFSERLSDLVSLLSEVNWIKEEGNPWMASQAGFAGQKDLYTMLHWLVYLGEKPGEEAG